MADLDAIVVGASAGGPSALQFVLRHPEPVDALILLVPAAYPAAAATRLSPVRVWMTNAMAQGLLQDAAVISTLPPYELERIATPTLVETLLGVAAR